MRDMITRTTAVELKNNQFPTPLEITVNDRAATREALSSSYGRKAFQWWSAPPGRPNPRNRGWNRIGTIR